MESIDEKLARLTALEAKIAEQKERNRRYRAKPEVEKRILEYAKEYRSDPKNKQKTVEYKKKYRANKKAELAELRALAKALAENGGDNGHV